MSTNEARDDDRVALAMVIREAFLGVPGYEPDDEDYAIADAILAAGYVKQSEQEWEYGVYDPSSNEVELCGTEPVTRASFTGVDWDATGEYIVRRRVAGPWVRTDGEGIR